MKSQLAFVIGMLGLAAAGTLNLVARITPDEKLDGVEPPAPFPALSLHSIREESFQKGFATWFEQHWGLRGYAARTDNTIDHVLFHESKNIWIEVGNDGVIFPVEDVSGYVNRPSAPNPEADAAARMHRVQRAMAERNIAVVPVIIPAKTTAYRAFVPSRWQRAGAFATTDDTIYRPFVRSLTEAGVHFVDARAMMEAEHGAPETYFPRTGRHWRKTFACKVLQRVVEVANLGAPFDCTARIEPHPPRAGEEFDLFRLLDTWETIPTNVTGEWFEKRDLPALRVPTLYVGSSFVWQFLTITRELDVLEPSLFYYYDSRVIDGRTNETLRQVDVKSRAWREDTLSRRLIVVGMLESYLPGESDKFFAELEAAIAE